jgi:hypothetical protein
MAVISTFELLVKPQLPKDNSFPPGLPSDLLDKISQLRRNAIQGYFLTISNLSTRDLLLSLVFTVSNSADIQKVVPFLDTSLSDNSLGSLTPTMAGNKFGFSPLNLPANDTALFLLQPNFLSFPELLVDTNLEIRGYVEIFLSSLSGRPRNAQIQVTPEHRGTFYRFDEDDPNTISSLDQYAYSLPVQNGGLLRLTPSDLNA